MRKVTYAPKSWVRPQMKHLGKISDVAGAQGTGAQGAGTKT